MIDESEMSVRSKELLGSREAEAGNELETEQIKSRPLGQKCSHTWKRRADNHPVITHYCEKCSDWLIESTGRVDANAAARLT